MAVVLGPQTSLNYWRSSDAYHGEELIIERVAENPFTNCAHTLSDIEGINLWGLWHDMSDKPLDILVPSANCRSHTKRLSYTVFNQKLPSGSFCKAYRDVIVCSPELCFLLIAAHSSFYPLLLLGYELCGSYGINSSTDGFFNHDALTSVKDILSLTTHLKGARGVELARKTISHVVENSRSPTESKLSIMLSLPSKLGGFGLSGICANQTLSVPAKLQSQTNLKQITPDLYWPKHKLAIEYESTGYHGAASKSNDAFVRKIENRILLAKDSKRRRTYDAMGIVVQTVTAAEFSDFTELTRIAVVIGKHLGKHGVNTSPLVQQRRETLHSWIKYQQDSLKVAPVPIF